MQMHRRLAYPALLAVAIVLPFILRDAYMRHLLVMISIFAVLALSLDIIMGYMGQISLGHAAFFGIGAYTSALLCLKLGVPVWLGWLGAIVCAGITGFFIGYISLRRARGVTLAIITFGFGLILWLTCSNWYELTNAYTGISKIPPPVVAIPWLPRITFQTAFSYYYLALALLLFTVYLVGRLLRCRLGRAIIAIRENEDLAGSIGVDAFRHCILAFTLATALAGLAGAAYGHFIRFISPNLFSMDYMFIMLIMVLLGGRGTRAGPVLGAAIFVFLSESLRITEQLRLVILGMILLACIVFMPEGIYPRLASLWNRFIVERACTSTGKSTRR